MPHLQVKFAIKITFKRCPGLTAEAYLYQQTLGINGFQRTKIMKIVPNILCQITSRGNSEGTLTFTQNPFQAIF